jgi:hypothetical protein
VQRELRSRHLLIRIAAVLMSLLAFGGVFGLVKRETEARSEPVTPTPVATARPVYVPPNPGETPTAAPARPHARTRAS